MFVSKLHTAQARALPLSTLEFGPVLLTEKVSRSILICLQAMFIDKMTVLKYRARSSAGVNGIAPFKSTELQQITSAKDVAHKSQSTMRHVAS